MRGWGYYSSLLQCRGGAITAAYSSVGAGLLLQLTPVWGWGYYSSLLQCRGGAITAAYSSVGAGLLLQLTPVWGWGYCSSLLQCRGGAITAVYSSVGVGLSDSEVASSPQAILCCDSGWLFRLLHVVVGTVCLCVVVLVTVLVERRLCLFLMDRLPARVGGAMRRLSTALWKLARLPVDHAHVD